MMAANSVSRFERGIVLSDPGEAGIEQWSRRKVEQQKKSKKGERHRSRTGHCGLLLNCSNAQPLSNTSDACE
jgi:hypothetical protein